VSETYVTLWGNIATDPKAVETAAGLRITKFRLACTASRRDPQTGDYADGVTSWYSVSCWRDLGRNVATSLSKGQPVMVHGKQVVRDWETDDGRKGTEVSIDAVSVGHDLRWGEATFAKIRRSRSAATEAADGSTERSEAAPRSLASSLGNGLGNEPSNDDVGDALADAAESLTTLDPGAVDRVGWGDLAERQGAA
jgi:single-strand DNA-binding protein